MLLVFLIVLFNPMFVFTLKLIRVLIGSLVSSIKVSLGRFTRKSFTIYKPNVSLEDRRANVSRDQRHSASTQLTTMCLLRRVLVETFSKESRILFQRRGSYFGKSTDAFQYYLRKSIAIGLPFTYRLVYI